MDKKTISTLMSSSNDDWGTPQELYDYLDELFKFDLDVCADWSNAKAEYYYDEELDGLKQRWFGNCWMNPPYSKPSKKMNKPGLIHWIDKAIKESRKKRVNCVVALLPARTETNWYYKIWKNADLIVFLRGRLKFGGAKSSAPFPSVVAVFGWKDFREVITDKLKVLGTIIMRYEDKRVWVIKKTKKKKKN